MGPAALTACLAAEIQEAYRHAEELDAWALERPIELVEIPEPPFMETERGIRFGDHLAIQRALLVVVAEAGMTGLVG